MGATLMRRSRVVLLFSTEMPCFVAFSTCDVSAGFLRISGILLVAEETYRRQEWIPAFLSPQKSTMPTIKARKQAHGSTRYTAIVRIRRGTAASGEPDLYASDGGAELGEASGSGTIRGTASTSAASYDMVVAHSKADFSAVLIDTTNGRTAWYADITTKASGTLFVNEKGDTKGAVKRNH